MRKIFICLLAISLLFVPVSAQENTDGKQNKPVLQILQEQGAVVPFDDEIYNTDYYNYFDPEYSNTSMVGIDIQGDIAIRMYDESYAWSYYTPGWEGFGSLEEIISVTKAVQDKEKRYPYLVFSDHPIIIRKCYLDSGEILITLSDRLSLGVATCVTDMLSDAIYQSALHTPDNEYTQILCFRNRLSGMGTAVYYVGTKETIVFYYQTPISERMELTMDEYHQYTHEFWDYMASDEMNVGANGNIVSGGFTSFEEFVEERKEAENADNASRMNKFWQSYKYIFIPAVIIVTCGLSVLIVHKNRKSK